MNLARPNPALSHPSPQPPEHERTTYAHPSRPARQPVERQQTQGRREDGTGESKPHYSDKARREASEYLADGLFFQQLLEPFAGPGPGGQQQHDAQGQTANRQVDGLASNGLVAWRELVDELAVRLPAGTGQALEATLCLPNLGRIGLNARNRPPRGWDIELQCASPQTAEHLNRHHQRCQKDLSHALSEAVSLHVQHRRLA